jgi:MFS family permease
MTHDEAGRRRTNNMVILSAWLAVFCLFAYRSSFSLLLRPLSADMGWTTGQTSLGYSLMMTIYGITAYFAGKIVDKYGTRQAFAIGAVFGALGFVLCSFSQSYGTYLATYSLFAGIGTGMLWVTSQTVVRQWNQAKAYGKAWGLVFMGAPMVQVLFTLLLKSLLQSMDWREAMRIMGLIVFILLAGASFISRKKPSEYGYEPYGLVAPAAGGGSAKPAYVWTVATTFKKYAVWGAVFAFLTSMMAEFLIWTQLVNYWITSYGYTPETAANMYLAIGVFGLLTMPTMGLVSDWVVGKMGHEPKARKTMIIIAPAFGIVGALLLRMSSAGMAMCVIACVFFAVYWAIEPGGVAGYVASLFGGPNFGKIWGMGTVVVMSIGPATGSFLGGFFLDLTGSYNASFLYATFSFVASLLLALSLPLAVKPPSEAA